MSRTLGTLTTETLARYVHDWGALDVKHGKYTVKCICNIHAWRLAEDLVVRLEAAIDEVKLQGMGEIISGSNNESWADGFRQGHLAARDAVTRQLR